MALPGPLAGFLLLINGIIGFYISLLIYRRNPSEILNRLISVAMVAYSCYLFFRGVIFVLPLSMFAIFDLLRDLSLSGALFAALFAALSGFYAWKGLDFIKQTYVYGMFLGLTIIALILGVFFDAVVYNEQTDIINNQFTHPIGLIGVFIIPLLLMGAAVFAYLQTFLTIDKDSPMYRKALILPIGLIVITLGIIYGTIMAAMGYPPIAILGDIFYITGSLLLFIAFR
ncbi:MAG: hypothetical protein ACFFC7_33935 [Candidatus Hermodarchaeota archaeon]